MIRLWETLQSRLPVEFEVAGIKTIEEANIFLSEFIKEYNQKFAVEPKEAESASRQLDDKINLDYVLCVKETRQVDNGSTFSLDKTYYKVVKRDKTMPIPPKAKITVLKSNRIGLKADKVANFVKTFFRLYIR